jgi:hypothetical protein
MDLEPIVKSVLVEPPAPEERREVVQATLKPDLTGLDRQAFRVLPGESRDGTAVIVPVEGELGGAAADAVDAADAAAEAEAAFAEADAAAEAIGETYGGVDSGADSGENSGRLDALQAEMLGDPRSRLRNLPGLAGEGTGAGMGTGVGTGAILAQQATLDAEPVAKEDLFFAEDSVVSPTGAFVPLGTTGVMKPIGEDLLSYSDGGEIYVADADDTTIAERYSRSGEYSEPELMNIPDSRVKSFFGAMGDRFSGKKKEKLNSSPSKWLGVDRGFNARKEGNQIGSWDNFHEDDDDAWESAGGVGAGAGVGGVGVGGAGGVGAGGAFGGGAFGAFDEADEDADEGWNGGAFGGASHEENVKAVMDLSQGLLDKEVWLVALGAGGSKNAGVVNLFANHSSELKNALFINLLGVGRGNLVFTIAEGNYRPVQTDHRMQNLISGAAQGMAIPVAPVKFSAFATDGTEALKRGGRAISLMGLGNQMPVDWRWADNDVSRLKEDNLLDAVALLIETIKNS